jgi:integrase/recombinase XerD
MPPRRRPLPAAESTVKAERAPVRHGDPSSHLEPFLNYLKAEVGASENTRIAYRSDLTQFLDWFRQTEKKGLSEIDLKTFSRYLAYLHARDLAATTVARHLAAIKMFFRFLVLESVLLESAADLLDSPKLWQHLPHVLSPNMVDRLLAAPASCDRFRLRDRALLALLYATGCRASEVSALKLSNVQLAEAYCRCLGKGNKERLVSLNPVACHAVAVYLEHERPALAGVRNPEELLISKSGRPLTRIMIWNLVKKYARRIGASADVSPHTLRHSFATHMLAGGAEIRALQELLGHASVATTQIYTHVEHTRLKAIHQRCHPRG